MTWGVELGQPLCSTSDGELWNGLMLFSYCRLLFHFGVEIFFLLTILPDDAILPTRVKKLSAAR